MVLEIKYEVLLMLMIGGTRIPCAQSKVIVYNSGGQRQHCCDFLPINSTVKTLNI